MQFTSEEEYSGVEDGVEDIKDVVDEKEKDTSQKEKISPIVGTISGKDLKEQIASSISNFVAQQQDLSSCSMKDIKKMLKEKHLYTSENKDFIKTTTIQTIQALQKSKGADDGSDDSEEERNFRQPVQNNKQKRKAKAKAPKQRATKKQKGTQKSPTLTQLYALARAMSIGPTVFKGLNGLADSQKCEQLAERLKSKEHCPKFQGLKPSSAVIAAATRATEKRKMLEGLDLSVVLDSPVRGGGRGGRRSKAPVSYYADSCSEVEASEEDEEEEW